MSRAKFNSLEISMMEEYGFECGEIKEMRERFRASHRLMVRRMTDPNDKDYHNYGLRFNEIFDFRKYEDFYVDYFPLFCKRVYENGCMNLTIERKNNDIS